VGGNTGPLVAIAYSPDGTLLGGGFSDSIKLWNTSDGTVFRTLDIRWTTALTFSANGAYLASGSQENYAEIVIWRVSDGQQIQTLFGHTNSPRALAFSPDGAVLASGGDETIRLWCGQ